MDAMKITNHSNSPLMLGDNFFEAGAITLAAGASVAPGVVLKRSSGYTFAVAAAGDDFAAVNPTFLENTGSASAAVSARVLISGRVNRTLLKVGAAEITAAQEDLLRNVGIVPIKVTELGQPDNQ